MSYTELNTNNNNECVFGAKGKSDPLSIKSSVAYHLYCLFGLKEIIDFRSLFSTTKCFGSKKNARVSHKEFNSLWSDEAKKKICIFLGRKVVRG